MTDPLATLTTTARHEQNIRKSRFLAQAAPVADEAAAMAFLDAVAEHSANHNCWAWRLGQNYRFSDDGEPGSSAGKPILTAIEGQNLDRVMVVVTRWFGGIKLGIGGLVRAYGGTAAECLRLAPQTEIVDMVALRFRLGYAEMELFRARTRDWRSDAIHEDYGARDVAVSLKLARQRVPQLQALLADLSRGQCRLVQEEDGDGG